MKKNEMKLRFLFTTALLFAVGCPAPFSGAPGGSGVPGGTGTLAGTVSGTVRDSVTGALLQGATVVIGMNTVLTNADGAFSFQYTSDLSAPIDVFVYKGTDYQFCGATNVQIDVTANPVYNFYLLPNSVSGYPVITLTGNLPEAAGANAELKLTITNSEGGISTVTASPSPAATTYMVGTPTFGADCTVSVYYKDDSLSTPIIQYYRHVNLSAPLTLDITAFPTTLVTVNGTAGEIFMGTLDLSPCDIPNYIVTNTPLGPSPSMDLNIYNEAALPIIWTTAAMSFNTPATDYQTLRYHFGPSTPFSTTVTLPASASTLPAPTGGVDQSTFTWNADTRTISFNPASGATLHVVALTDDYDHQGRFFVNMPADVIVLPEDFVTDVLDPGTGWDCRIMPLTADQSLSSFIDMRYGEMGPMNISNFQMAIVDSHVHLNRRVDLIP